MAWQIFGLVLDLPITKEFTSELKFTALVYANFAKPDGTDSYPSRETVAGITGYHERSIQRYQHRLADLGILIPDGAGRKGTNKYKFPVVSIGGELKLDINTRGDTQSPRQSDRGDIPSGDIPSGGRMSPKPIKPLKTTATTTLVQEGRKERSIFDIFKEEIGIVTPSIEKVLTNAVDSYSKEWVIDAMEESAKCNKRNWKYCEAILRRWKDEGKENPHGYSKDVLKMLSEREKKVQARRALSL